VVYCFHSTRREIRGFEINVIEKEEGVEWREGGVSGGVGWVSLPRGFYECI